MLLNTCLYKILRNVSNNTMLNDSYKNKINISCPVEGVPSNAVSIVDSVAQEEFALAELLNAQASLLCKAINPCISVCDFKTLVQSIIRTMKNIIQKNNILEVKLRETLNFIQKEKIDCIYCKNFFPKVAK